jgi:hypothetical protein
VFHPWLFNLLNTRIAIGKNLGKIPRFSPRVAQRSEAAIKKES